MNSRSGIVNLTFILYFLPDHSKGTTSSSITSEEELKSFFGVSFKSLFLFSTEHTEGEGFILNNSGRYAHSKDYIMSVASQSRFKLKLFTKCNLRYERDAWVIGGIYVLKD